MQIHNFKLAEKSFYFITLFIIIWVGMRLSDAPMERDEGTPPLSICHPA